MAVAADAVGKHRARQGDEYKRRENDLRRRGWGSFLERALVKSLERREGRSPADSWGKSPLVPQCTWMVREEIRLEWAKPGAWRRETRWKQRCGAGGVRSLEPGKGGPDPCRLVEARK